MFDFDERRSVFFGVVLRGFEAVWERVFFLFGVGFFIVVERSAFFIF